MGAPAAACVHRRAGTRTAHRRAGARTARGLAVGATRVVESALVVIALVVTAPNAAAATGSADDDGLWYVTRTGVAEAHQRTTGAGVRIAVIDTAINPDVPALQGVRLRVHEPSFCADGPGGDALPARSAGPDAARGTTTVALIVGTGSGTGGRPGIRGVAPGAAVSFYAAATQRDAQPRATLRCAAPGTDGTDADARATDGTGVGGLGVETTEDTATTDTATADIETTDAEDLHTDLRLRGAIDAAVADGTDILAIALSTPSRESSAAITRALDAGVLVVAAQGPSSTGGFPADLDGVVSVDAVGPDDTWWVDRRVGATVLAPGGLVRTYGPWFDDDERSSVAANAVAFTAGALALVRSAYPDATANQLVQSLIRNTGAEDHALREPVTEVGYGVVDVPHLLSHDPRQYPDVNPLLTATSPHGAVLGTESGPRASASASPAPAVGDSSGGASGGPPNPTSTPSAAPVVVGIGLLLAAATAGLVVRRRAATGGSAPGTPTLREAGG